MLKKIDKKILHDLEVLYHWLHMQFGISLMTIFLCVAVAKVTSSYLVDGGMFISIFVSSMAGWELYGILKTTRPGFRNINEARYEVWRILLLVVVVVFGVPIAVITILVDTSAFGSTAFVYFSFFCLIEIYLICLTPPPPGSEKGRFWTQVKTFFQKPVTQ